jgi:teichuronic acid biosynthesis glycosyltransferase TuaH
MSVVEQQIYTSTAPQAAQAPDGITVLGVQFASIASLFGPLHDRADLSLIHVNDWLNVWRGRNRVDRFGPPAGVDWQEWRFPPGWANRFAPWFMPNVARRILRTWRQRGWRNPRLVITFPYFLPVARKIGLHRTLYYAVDNYQAFWPDRAAIVAAQEDELIRGAAAIVATSSLLADWFKTRVPASSDKIHYIPNGISPPMLRPREAALEGPARLQPRFAERFGDRTGPIVGHYSTIAPKYGVELLIATAERLPDFRFILMGQVVPGPPDHTEAIAHLSSLPNVVMTGHLKEPGSRNVLWQCDIMIITVPMDELCIYTCPNRLWTFMATGRPIVSTPIPEVTKFGDLVYIGDSADDFVGALRAAAREHDRDRMIARIEIAKTHIWPVLADQMWSVLTLQ